MNLPRPKFAPFDHSVTSVCHELSSDAKIFITYLVYIWFRNFNSEKNVFCLCCLADAAVLKYCGSKIKLGMTYYVNVNSFVQTKVIKM